MTDPTNLTRRSLVGTTIAGATAAGVVAVAASMAPTAEAFADALSAVDANVDDENAVGFLLNVGDCIDCGNCVEACKRANNTPEGMPARRHLSYVKDANGEDVVISTACMHCKEPACVDVCPAGAIVKRGDGIVALRSERCIGCKYCSTACPFDVPVYGAVMGKCDFCVGNGVRPGTKPRCAAACPTGALDAGRLRDMFNRAAHRHEVAVENVLSEKRDIGSELKQVESSTKPNLYLRRSVEKEGADGEGEATEGAAGAASGE